MILLVVSCLLQIGCSSVEGVKTIQQIPPRITEHPHNLTVLPNDPATLQCSANGQPPPVITWFRDGRRVSGGSRPGRRIVLPGGSLFFLRVIRGRTRGDSGVYWCQARNSAGIVTSRNATLTVAHLDSEFRTVPAETRAILGDLATLHCRPPRGQPRPEITWKKNGVPLDLSTLKRYRVDEEGSLTISKLTFADGAEYQCLAGNVAGTRESLPVRLSVHQRPLIIHPPENLTVSMGQEAIFQCTASGDPIPSITWRKNPGRIRIAGRGRILKLENVTPNDSGRYICEAWNAIGSVSAWVELTVMAAPHWLETGTKPRLPKVTRAVIGREVKLHCPVSGIPAPLVFWNREGSPQSLLVDSDRFESSDGILTIKNLGHNDSGVFWCGAINEAGGFIAKTRLEVDAAMETYPPVIEIGPRNQTLVLGSTASLICQTEGVPVKWIKDGVILNLESSSSTKRVFLENRKNLRIKSLRFSDSGIYTCIADRGNLSTSWSASLNVVSKALPEVPGHFEDVSDVPGPEESSSDILFIPGSPSQPRLLHQTPDSLTISWKPGTRPGASRFLGYTVEVFSSNQWEDPYWTWAGLVGGAERSWRITIKGLEAEKTTITNLKAGAAYVLLVRAENLHGMSLPSPVSPWFRVPGPQDVERDSVGLREVEQRMRKPLVELVRVRSVNCSAARLEWKFVEGGSDPAEGLYLWYRPLLEWDSKLGPSFDDQQSFQIATIVSPDAKAYTLVGLTPNTRYVFFLVPFYRNIEGCPSNSRTETTPEAAPSGPPLNLTSQYLNSSSVLIHWDQPDLYHRNGLITGYQIFVFLGESGSILANLTLPSVPTSVVIGGLIQGSSYAIRAAAWTKSGLGPLSQILWVSMGSRTTETPNNDDRILEMQEKWMVVILGAGLLILLFFTAALIIIKRRWARRKSLNTFNNPNPRCEDLWSRDSGLCGQETNPYGTVPAEYAELLTNSSRKSTEFLNKEKQQMGNTVKI